MSGVAGTGGRLPVYFALGRVSNLPTVVTNVIAGVVLGGGSFAPGTTAALVAAATLLYGGGMFLNDAFDREHDRRHRPERPIPAGAIAAGEVFAVGFGALLAGVLIVLAVGGAGAGLAAAALAATIVLYDAWHKGNPIGPGIMASCRALLYVTAALGSGGSLGSAFWVGAAAMLAYVVGLTAVAKQEQGARFAGVRPLIPAALPLALHAPAAVASSVVALAWALLLAWVAHAGWRLSVRGRQAIPATIGGLIAGISLLDALAMAAAGAPLGLVAIAVLGWPATLYLQRHVSGT